MARVEISPRELDTTFAIESAIREVFEGESIARVSLATIAIEYDVLDEQGEIVECTLTGKCQHLADKFRARFELRDCDVWLLKLPAGILRAGVA
jgi:hypothetical protein